ncbi:MAG TPA: epoxyqueuosine reductase QueH [Erysipelotrichaceae bacterium]|nr:epoxyqueuosine reductase QueH [Erysipelotrichaceae bacterium]
MRKLTDYQWEIEKIEELKKLRDKPKLLMQSCCAVCNSWPLEYLYPIFDITIYYNNSNIYPASEYDTRISELRDYVQLFNERNKTEIKVVEEPYDYDAYKLLYLEKRASDKEGSNRCGMCYALRINQAMKYASDHDYAFVTTVMTISRQKNSDKINGIARRLANGYLKVNYFYSNFKKNKGIDFAVNTAKQLGIYKQEYCGCEYSIHEKEFDV